MQRFVDKAAIVTGAARGMGRACSLSLAAEGAKIALVDLNKKVAVSNDTLHSPFLGWTIYEGWELKGWPILTMLRGKVIVQDGQIVGEPGYGKYIPCKLW